MTLTSLVARHSAAVDTHTKHMDAMWVAIRAKDAAAAIRHDNAAQRMFKAEARYDDMVAWERWNVAQRAAIAQTAQQTT